MSKRFYKILTGICSLCILFQMSFFTSRAADDYTYTITFYAGNQGTFADGSTKISISDKKLGDMVSFDLNQVKPADESRYYVKGIRKSGRDNDESIIEPSFEVTEDADYVIAYGIKGEQVAYTVNYYDAQENALMPSRTLYGNVGDKPVVAFLYVEGYQPQAYNLTKTLQSNEAENVFTFKYEKVEVPAAANQPQPEGTTATGTGTATAAQPGDAGAGAGAAAAADNAGAVTEIPDDAVPTDDGPDDLIDLDDTETPLANMRLDEIGSIIPYPAIAAGAVVLAAAVSMLVWVWRKKKLKEEQNEA